MYAACFQAVRMKAAVGTRVFFALARVQHGYPAVAVWQSRVTAGG